MTQQNSIYVACTGGTIDSFYNPEDGVPHYVPQDGETAVPSGLEHIGKKEDCVIRHYGTYDSKDLYEMRDDVIREIITDAMNAGHNKVLITMGTDTMPQTARYTRDLLHKYGEKGRNMTVVFTGSMVPLRDAEKEFRETSDGVENLEFAINALQGEHKGVFVAMHANGEDRTMLLNPEFLHKKVYTDGADGDRNANVTGSGFLYEVEKAQAAERLGRSY